MVIFKSGVQDSSKYHKISGIKFNTSFVTRCQVWQVHYDKFTCTCSKAKYTCRKFVLLRTSGNYYESFVERTVVFTTVSCSIYGSLLLLNYWAAHLFLLFNVSTRRIHDRSQDAFTILMHCEVNCRISMTVINCYVVNTTVISLKLTNLRSPYEK